MAAALVAMVANLTIGRKKYAEVEGEMVDVLKQADTIRLSMMQAVEADAAAYQKVMEAYKLPKESDAEKTTRSAAIQAATLVAAQVPLSVAQTCASLLPLACEVAEKGNANAITDAASALTFANAAMIAALLNVEINLSGLKDEVFVVMAKEEKEKLRKAAAEYAVKMEDLLQERAQISMR
jgi:formiminotetrahydrofolate cyclodeaminase